MKNIVIILILPLFIIQCNSYNDKMNSLLQGKKQIDTRMDSGKAREQRFRIITGYDERLDSISEPTVYKNPELVDSIRYLKSEREYLIKSLEQITYSIDSLQKLK